MKHRYQGQKLLCVKKSDFFTDGNSYILESMRGQFDVRYFVYYDMEAKPFPLSTSFNEKDFYENFMSVEEYREKRLNKLLNYE